MMTPEQLALARRYAADPRWRWRPGMQVTPPDENPGHTFRLAWRRGSVSVWVRKRDGKPRWLALGDVYAGVPNLADPSTADLLPAWEP